MAQVKLLKINANGVHQEMNPANDDITLNSYTVEGAGIVLSDTGLEMNDHNISNVANLTFDDPATGTINQTAGLLVVDNIMAKERENLMTTAGGISFPVITDVAGQVDAFRLPQIAGAPTATPTTGGEGHVVWDSTNNTTWIWDGAAWNDQGTVNAANYIENTFTAGENIDAAELVYISDTDEVSLCDVSAAGQPSRGIGFAQSTVLAAASVGIVSDGIVDGFTGLTPGARYFANPATPGGVTATTPVTGVILQVGFAKSATVMQIQIQRMAVRD